VLSADAIVAGMSSYPFLTDYDPAGGIGGSIDPLGSLRTYLGLVDLLLPGITTITTRSRYASVLCAALTNAKQRDYPAGASGVAARRRAMEPYERLWALACATAKEEGVETAAADLRGISYAEKALRELRQRGRVASPEYEMLKSQSRTGGVATYWGMLLSADLVTEGAIITPTGELLAREFPSPPMDNIDRLADPLGARRVSIDLEALERWGRHAHLGAARQRERNLLLEALRADERRDRVATALERYATQRALPARWSVADLRRLEQLFADDELAAKLNLPLVIQAAIRVEQFHEAVLALFETLLWWGTMRADDPVADLVSAPAFVSGVDVARGTAAELEKFATTCESAPIRKGLEEFARFAGHISRVGEPRAFLEELLRRHRRVQEGKIDGGTPKREWISYGQALRPSPRYQRTERPKPARGQQLTHPYRLEQFAAMLQENGALPVNRAGDRNAGA
jgi:hypothetical protein